MIALGISWQDGVSALFIVYIILHIILLIQAICCWSYNFVLDLSWQDDKHKENWIQKTTFIDDDAVMTYMFGTFLGLGVCILIWPVAIPMFLGYGVLHGVRYFFRFKTKVDKHLKEE